jgi:hypothetical protein
MLDGLFTYEKNAYFETFGACDPYSAISRIASIGRA